MISRSELSGPNRVSCTSPTAMIAKPSGDKPDGLTASVRHVVLAYPARGVTVASEVVIVAFSATVM